ncbi:MAG: hypothetical protein ACK5Y2_01775 [Bdellovibrionales bacterium]
MKRTQIVSVGLGLFLSCAAKADYLVATYLNSGNQPTEIVRGQEVQRATHILVAAQGDELGLQFHMSAAAHARKILDVNPSDRIVLIAVSNDSNEITKNFVKRWGATSVQEMMSKWGFRNFVEHKKELSTGNLTNELLAFDRIASLNIYSHSTGSYGLILDGSNALDKINNRVSQTSELESLAGRFLPGAYAWFHGCNTAITVAPAIARQWGIPVAGSYTSSAFQELFFDNTPIGAGFYHSYPGNVPLTKNNAGNLVERRIGMNRISFKSPQSCNSIPCVRMKPDNVSYVGYWGSFREGGLGFYRFVCPTPISQEACLEGMATGLVNQVGSVYADYSSDLATYKKMAQDILCPNGMDTRRLPVGYTVEKCVADLEAALVDQKKTVDTFRGNSLMCRPYGKGCAAEFACEEANVGGFLLVKQGSCKLKNHRTSAPNQTQANEYRQYVQGFQLMKARRASRR